MNELLELSSKLEIETRKTADEMIAIMRRDIDYLQRIAELERKIAIMLNGKNGSILVRNNNGKLEF